MALSVALVTPFAWSQPHDVNEHVDGLARELRARGHRVTVLAPSNRARELAAGRRALVSGLEDAELVALGPAVPISRRSRMGVPVGVRANLAIALAAGGFDVVHGFEPGLPSLSYLALRDAASLTVATFFSPERLPYPPARTRAPRPRASAHRPRRRGARRTLARDGGVRAGSRRSAAGGARGPGCGRGDRLAGGPSAPAGARRRRGRAADRGRGVPRPPRRRGP